MSTTHDRMTITCVECNGTEFEWGDGANACINCGLVGIRKQLTDDEWVRQKDIKRLNGEEERRKQRERDRYSGLQFKTQFITECSRAVRDVIDVNENVVTGILTDFTQFAIKYDVDESCNKYDRLFETRLSAVYFSVCYVLFPTLQCELNSKQYHQKYSERKYNHKGSKVDGFMQDLDEASDYILKNLCVSYITYKYGSRDNWIVLRLRYLFIQNATGDVVNILTPTPRDALYYFPHKALELYNRFLTSTLGHKHIKQMPSTLFVGTVFKKKAQSVYTQKRITYNTAHPLSPTVVKSYHSCLNMLQLRRVRKTKFVPESQKRIGVKPTRVSNTPVYAPLSSSRIPPKYKLHRIILDRELINNNRYDIVLELIYHVLLHTYTHHSGSFHPISDTCSTGRLHLFNRFEILDMNKISTEFVTDINKFVKMSMP
jgi:hypothetical protein